MPILKFTLTYDGELPSTANSSRKTEKKWEIRKHFHPQLEELWRSHSALRRIHQISYIPASGGGWMIDLHHDFDTPPVRRELMEGEIDLCAPIIRGSRAFRPLVRNSFALVASLNVHFLRRGAAGKIYQGGDIDGRIKTLLDALSVPAHPEQVLEDDTVDGTVQCVFEDDALITGLNVQTSNLLANNVSASEKHVRLTIDVDVRVTDARYYNTLFLGD